MYEDREREDRNFDYSPRRPRRRPGELKSWLVCALFGMAFGFAVAANFGEAFDAAGNFAGSLERTRGEGRKELGAGLLDDRASIPQVTAAAAAQLQATPRDLGPRDIIPSGAMNDVDGEEAEGLAPGARLVLRDRVELFAATQGGR